MTETEMVMWKLALFHVLQKFDKRSAAVTETEMHEYWKHLSYVYMTEESDDPDDPNAIVVYKLPW